MDPSAEPAPRTVSAVDDVAGDDGPAGGSDHRWGDVALAGLGGLVSAAAGMAVAEVLAGTSADLRSPVLDVGDRVVDGVPVWAKDLAIAWFGTNDKVALLVGIGVALAVYAVAMGIVGLRRRLALGMVGIALFGVIGAVASTAGRTETGGWVALPSLVGAAAAAGALYLLARLGSGSDEHLRLAPRPSVPTDGDRRRFLVGVGGLAASAAVLGASGRWLQQRFSAAASRAAVVLRGADVAAPAPPPGLQAPGAAPFFTSNADFYRIDTALAVPQVAAETWQLDVTGMVGEPMTLTYADLLERELVESDITLTCVSNTVGGELIGTARWLGVRLDDLLADVGVDPGADQIVGRSVDGYTCGFPVAVLDGRDALVAVAMNGEALPLEHGFPARLIVPGLYGYVSATKWLSEIELTTFDAFDAYWVPRGYAQRAPIKIQSRIDSPRGLDRIAPGPFAIGGVAWAQPIGIGAVELSIDDGPWQPAELATELSGSTWRQWTLPWDATPGRHSITVRATDRDGAIQTPDRSEPLPDGASGHHTVVVLVDEA